MKIERLYEDTASRKNPRYNFARKNRQIDEIFGFRKKKNNSVDSPEVKEFKDIVDRMSDNIKEFNKNFANIENYYMFVNDSNFSKRKTIYEYCENCMHTVKQLINDTNKLDKLDPIDSKLQYIKDKLNESSFEELREKVMSMMKKLYASYVYKYRSKFISEYGVDHYLKLMREN